MVGIILNVLRVVIIGLASACTCMEIALAKKQKRKINLQSIIWDMICIVVVLI